MSAETIYALSSGKGRAGISVVRFSGPKAWSVAESLAGRTLQNRRAIYCRLRDPATNETLDNAICLGFVGPNSYTGEDVVELHVHGGLAVIAGVFEVLGEVPGLRLAEPGEFTRRAFENDKMDLTGVEAVGDLIEAETAAQRRQALRQSDGVLASQCERWRTLLVSAFAHWEALLDFSDEEIPEALEAETRQSIEFLAEDMSKNLDDGGAGERLRSGLRLAIIGPPNAGKSSILNGLAARDVGIVSSTPGTTRDVLEAYLDLGGFPVIAMDTAGLREGAEGVEREGIRRARQQAEDADLRLIVFDVADWPECLVEFSEWMEKASLIAVNKTDLGPRATQGEPKNVSIYEVSAKTGAGITALVEAIVEVAAQGMGGSAEPIITRARHREALQDCLDALRVFLGRSDWSKNPEIASEHLRIAAGALGRVVGRVDADELLDVIFRDFCVGK